MLISDLGKVVTGKTPTTKDNTFWNDGIVPFVTPGDLQSTKHIFKTERCVSEKGKQAVKGVVLPPNAICVSCIGNIGYVGVTTQECISNQQINSIIPNAGISSDYVYYLVKSLWSYFKHYEGQSTTLSILNKTQFSKIEVPDHTEEQRNSIAKILSAIDDKIESNIQINDNLAA